MADCSSELVRVSVYRQQWHGSLASGVGVVVWSGSAARPSRAPYDKCHFRVPSGARLLWNSSAGEGVLMFTALFVAPLGSGCAADDRFPRTAVGALHNENSLVVDGSHFARTMRSKAPGAVATGRAGHLPCGGMQDDQRIPPALDLLPARHTRSPPFFRSTARDVLGASTLSPATRVSGAVRWVTCHPVGFPGGRASVRAGCGAGRRLARPRLPHSLHPIGGA